MARAQLIELRQSICDDLSTVVSRVSYRVVQTERYLRPRSMPPLDAALRVLLSPAQMRLVGSLPASDRAHLLDVHRRLVLFGCQDRDLLNAALLHDVGKIDARARVGLTHRVFAVLLGRLAPGALARVARPSRLAWRHGLYLALAHAALGAALARERGCSPRVVWLIQHHHDLQLAHDPALRLLHAADNGG